MLIEGGNKVASIADIFTGKMPGQNTPATTTMETVKQSSAVFTAIYKRIYRSFDKELKKLAKLNSLYLDDVVDYPVDLTKEDYKNTKLQVIPTADPDTATDSEKLAKAQALLQLLNTGVLDPMAVVMRVLEAMRIEQPQTLIRQGPPPPSPEQQKAQAQQEVIKAKAQAVGEQAQLKKEGMQTEAQMKGVQQSQEYAHKERMAQLSEHEKARELEHKATLAALDQGKAAAAATLDVQHKAAANVEARSHTARMNDLKRKAAASKPKPKGKK